MSDIFRDKWGRFCKDPCADGAPPLRGAGGRFISGSKGKPKGKPRGEPKGKPKGEPKRKPRVKTIIEAFQEIYKFFGEGLEEIEKNIDGSVDGFKTVAGARPKFKENFLLYRHKKIFCNIRIMIDYDDMMPKNYKKWDNETGYLSTGFYRLTRDRIVSLTLTCEKIFDNIVLKLGIKQAVKYIVIQLFYSPTGKKPGIERE